MWSVSTYWLRWWLLSAALIWPSIVWVPVAPRPRAHYSARRTSPSLMRLHVSTLRLNPNAGERPRYAMRRPRLALVKLD